MIEPTQLHIRGDLELVESSLENDEAAIELAAHDSMSGMRLAKGAPGVGSTAQVRLGEARLARLEDRFVDVSK